MMARSYELQMLDLFRAHFFVSRSRSRLDFRKVSPNQAFVLSELVRRECPTLEELHKVLKLHVSSLSRAISRLEKAGMVHIEKDPRDSRRKRFLPTAEGKAFAKLSWVSQQAVIAERLEGFLPIERTALESFLRVFAGEEAYRRIVPISGEPEMAIISRAMTYDHGVVSDNFLESGYPVLDWIILSEIHYGGRSPSSLAKVARTPPSTLSLRLKSLREKGLLIVAVGKHDKRARQFQLTRKGVKELESIEKAATRFFARTLRALPAPQIEQGIKLFERYARALHSSKRIDLSLERLGKDALDPLRRSILSTLVEAGERYPLHAVLLHPENHIFELFLGADAVLVLECVAGAGGDFQLINGIPLEGADDVPSSELVRSELEQYLGAPVKIPRALAGYIDGLHKAAVKAGGE